jgi:hypothetical protein
MIELKKISKKPNGRKPVKILCDGQEMTLKEYADYCGISYVKAFMEYKKHLPENLEKREQ